MSFADKLKVLASFLGFASRTAPALVPELRKIVEQFSKAKNIPKEELLPALDADAADAKMAAIDAEVDRELREIYET